MTAPVKVMRNHQDVKMIFDALTKPTKMLNQISATEFSNLSI